MVLLSEIKEEIIRKTILNPSLSVILKGDICISLHVGIDTEVQRSLHLTSLGNHLCICYVL